MATVAELLVEIKTKSAGLAQGLKKATSSVGKFVKDVGKRLKQIAKFITVSVLGAVALFTAALRGTSAEMDKLVKTSEKLGVAVGDLQKLHYQAKLSGVSIETLNMALQRMVRRVSEAAQGTGEAVNALKELRIDATQLARLSPDKQFERVAEAFKYIGNQGDKVRLAMKLFDSEGVALVNTLSSNLNKTGQEFEKLGVSITEQQKKAIVAYEDSKTKLDTIWQGFKQNLTAQIAPALQFLIEKIQEFVKEQGGIKAIANEVALTVVSGAKAMIQAFNSVKVVIDGLKVSLDAVAVLYARVTNPKKRLKFGLDKNGNFNVREEYTSKAVTEAQDRLGASTANLISKTNNPSPTPGLDALLKTLKEKEKSLISGKAGLTPNRFTGLQTGTFGFGGSGSSKITIKVEADDSGIIKTVVNNEEFKGKIGDLVKVETNNAARATRR